MERALQHIEDAKRLTAELGGTDKDVKEYFFSLPPHQLTHVLDQYERQHGRSARQYAEATMPDWRSGRVHMSGTVAERLFSLLPPRMPLATKYKLTENLWKHVGPRSKKRLRVGVTADLELALDAVRTHINEVVVAYKVPENLERRFNWLSAGDVGVKQELLNHVRQMEKSLVVEGARVQLPVLMEHLQTSAGTYTHRATQTLIVGKHELEILLDKAFEGVALEEWSPLRSFGASGRGGAFWWWIILLGLAAFWLLRR